MSIPDTIGRFRIERQIGRGTTGIVYLAWDPSLNRRIAIKLLAPVLERDGEARKLASFERELRAAGGFSHPNIIAVHDVGHHDDRPFIAMEYIEGQSLEEILRSGGDLPPAVIADIGRQMAAALDHAHAESVIHRDVKLSNILLGKDGVAKLTDFGVAKLPYSDETMAGTAMGTPSYMAPETLVGRNVTGASDQFSLAVVLFELLTGDRPFAGPTSQAVMYRIVNEEPTSPSSVAPELPENVDAVFARALGKDPGTRFVSCTEMAEALGAAVGVPGEERLRPEVAARIRKRFTPPPKFPAGPAKRATPGAGPKMSRKWVVGAGIVLGLLAVAALIGWLVVGRQDPPSGERRVTEPVMRAERAVPDPAPEPPPETALPAATAEEGQEAQPEEIADELVDESPEIREPPPAGVTRTMRIVTNPAGARTYRNSELLEGATPLETVLEPATEYTFRVELAGHRPAGVVVSLESLSAEQSASGVLFFPLRADEVPIAAATAPDETAATEAVSERVEVERGIASLEIRLVSDIRRGVLMVYRGEEQLVRESFRFEAAAGEVSASSGPGILELQRELASGPAELRVYIMLRDIPASLVSVTTELEAGSSQVLVVLVDRDGVPRLELR